MQCRGRHKSFVFNIRDACFIMKMKNVKKIDMNKKLYEQIKALLADKLDEKEQKEPGKPMLALPAHIPPRERD